MKKQNRMLSLLLSFSLLLLLLAGCSPVGETPSQSEASSESEEDVCRILEDNAQTLIRPAYMEANRVKGVSGNTAEQNQSLPESHTVIIHDAETLNDIFTSFPEEVDFSKETVVLYMFANDSLRECQLKSTNLYDTSAEIFFHISFIPNNYDAIMPYQRAICILIGKSNITTVAVKEM